MTDLWLTVTSGILIAFKSLSTATGRGHSSVVAYGYRNDQQSENNINESVTYGILVLCNWKRSNTSSTAVSGLCICHRDRLARYLSTQLLVRFL